MTEPRYKGVNIDAETHDKLARLASQTYRSIPGMIRYLVDRALNDGLLDPLGEIEAIFPAEPQP